MSLPHNMLDHLKQVWRFLQRAMQKKRVRQLFYVGIVVISLAFIGYAVATNWTLLKSQKWHIDPLYLILVVVLYPLGMFPTAAAWHWLLRAFNTKKTYFLNLRLYAVSSLPKHIPGLVWYVTSRTLIYEEYGVSANVVLSATATETALLALTGFISALLIFSLQPDLPSQLSILRILSPLSLIALILLFVWAPGGTRLLDKLVKRFIKDAQTIQLQRPALFVCLGWMFIAWIGGGTLLWILINALTPIGWELLPIMIGMWGAAGAVSQTIGIGIQGLGLREVTLGAILSLVISPITAIIVVVAFRLVLTIGEFLWVFLLSIILKDKVIIQKGPIG
jgi:hypothetical protein